VIWILSNLKTDILNYLESQKLYGKNIFFDGDGFNFTVGNHKIQKKSIKVQETINIPELMKSNTSDDMADKVPAPTITIDENSVDSNWREAKTLDTLRNSIHNCMRCELGSTRTNFVFGEGNPNADLLIIGEAPGRDEDLSGHPFVGRSGKLLTSILEAIQLSRDDVYIANILKCRPPNNRRPSQSEVDKCEVYLHKQIELINPKYILALGLTAADTLLKEKCVMKDIRGKILEYQGKKLLITYHPSALLRNPNLKRPVWEDMKRLKALLNE
jgi:DNA polymerase